METLDSILARFRKEFGLEGPLSNDELKSLVYRHIDSDISPFVRSVWLEGNVLAIQVTEPVVLQEFQARAEGMRKRINRDAGRAAVASVRLTLRRSRRY
ncbi:MAG TPA: DUF721 domain-containing protein [Firmicutes bacterium]|nr:DUF721 domain-containing protein [Bacillota bacterium]